MGSAVDHHVVVQLVAAVIARHERRRVTDRAEQTAEGYLRIAHVGGVLRDALQTREHAEVQPLIRADLTTARVQIAKTELVQPSRAECVRVPERGILTVCRDGASEARHEGFAQRRRAKRLRIVHAVRRDASIERVADPEAMIQLEAELIHRIHLVGGGQKVLDAAAARRLRYLGQECECDGVEAIGGNLVPRKRRACATGHAGQRIANRRQPGEVTASKRRRRHRERLGLRLGDSLSFVTEEEERLIFLEWSADIEAELVLVKGRHRLGGIVEVIVRVEPIVAHEFERAPVKSVGAGLGDDVNERRCFPAELRGIHRLLNLELLNGVNRRADDEIIEVLVGHFDAVDQVDVVAAALPVHVGERAGLAEGRTASPAGRNRHAVGQLRELDELPAIEWHLLDLAVVDDLEDLRVGDAEKRRVGSDRNRVGELAELQRDRQVDLLADPQCQPLLFEPFEAGQLNRQLVVADRERREKEAALSIGDPFGLETTGHMKRHDVGAGNDRSLHIFHDA